MKNLYPPLSLGLSPLLAPSFSSSPQSSQKSPHCSPFRAEQGKPQMFLIVHALASQEEPLSFLGLALCWAQWQQGQKRRALGTIIACKKLPV